MKKELLTEQDYLDAHLKEFEATRNGVEIKGIIFVDDYKNVFLLQDSFNGCTPNNKEWNKFGYKFSWCNFSNGGKTITAMQNVTIEEWKPKFGEVVECSDEQDYFNEFRRNIFLFKKDGVFHVLDREKDAIKSFNSLETGDQGYTVYKYKFIRPIEEPKLELNWEEARQIISDTKGVKAENVNLKIK